MNNLSWLIYIADRVGTIAYVAGFLSVVLIIGMFFAFMYVQYMRSEGKPNHPYTIMWAILSLQVLLMLVFVFTPSKTAIYYIAASEAAATVVQSEAAQELLGDVQEVIRNQLKNLKE